MTLTAGGIARKLFTFAESLPKSEDQKFLLTSAEKFLDLVEVRNGILHATPATDKDGGQRLYRHGNMWSISELEKAADDFTECSMNLNKCLHGFLSQLDPK